MEEEAKHESDQPQGGEIPLGVRVTGWFLFSFMLVLTLPVMVVGMACVCSLGLAAHESREGLGAIGFSAVALLVFCALLAALLGANWLSVVIRAPHENLVLPRLTVHPWRAIAAPLVGVIRIYAALALVAGLAVMIVSGGSLGSLAWLCFWSVLGAGGHFLARMIDRHRRAQ